MAHESAERPLRHSSQGTLFIEEEAEASAPRNPWSRRAEALSRSLLVALPLCSQPLCLILSSWFFWMVNRLSLEETAGFS